MIFKSSDEENHGNPMHAVLDLSTEACTYDLGDGFLLKKSEPPKYVKRKAERGQGVFWTITITADPEKRHGGVAGSKYGYLDNKSQYELLDGFHNKLMAYLRMRYKVKALYMAFENNSTLNLHSHGYFYADLREGEAELISRYVHKSLGRPHTPSEICCKVELPTVSPDAWKAYMVKDRFKGSNYTFNKTGSYA